MLQVFSSLRAAKKVIQDQQLRPLLLLHPDALPEFDCVDCSQPNAVVLGLAQQAFSYDIMNAAFRLLMQQPQAPLIAIHKAKYYKAGDGQLALGPGPYAAALEFATGRTAQVGVRGCLHDCAAFNQICYGSRWSQQQVLQLQVVYPVAA
jgi:HAD superfamily hydrolase (TIGR01458 family)